MYAIYAGDTCIYSDISTADSVKAVNPKLTLEDNTAGSLTVTLPPGNAGYDCITRMVTDISVLKDGEEIWSGRVLSESEDFYRNRVLYCEGELAFFNDSTQPPAKYENLTVQAYLDKLIAVHNNKVTENRRFTLGAVTVHDKDRPTRYTNYDKTLDNLNALVEQYGGHLRVRKENGIRYLDYLEKYPNTSTQTIQFGSNLIDFTREWDSTEFATVIVPLGNRLEESEIEGLDAYLTVKEVNKGSPYVQSNEAVAVYGWIEKSVTWSDVSDANVLLEKAKAYLTDIQFDNMELELSALDLHYLHADADAIEFLDEVRVISRPHGLDRVFPVSKLEIPLDSPEQTQFKLGTSVKTSLTSVNNQTSAAILKQIDKLPNSVLEEAKKNAAKIMNLATTGFITITGDENGSETLYISNTKDYTAATKLWKWNVDGLGYSADGGENYEAAITMNGAIVANFITTGSMNAERIQTGILKSNNDNVIFDLDEGTLTMKSGSIQLGKYTDGHHNFEVDNEGNLYARNGIFAGQLDGATGTFGGKLVAAEGNFKGIVQASQFLDRNGNDMMTAAGKFQSQYLDLMGLNIQNAAGQTVMVIDENGVRFGAATSPAKSQFAEKESGPWHNEMQSGDKFRKDFLGLDEKGNDKWGEPYKFVAEDGKPGEQGAPGISPKLPSYIKSTKITETTIESPTIIGGEFWGNEFNIYSQLSDPKDGIIHYDEGSFNLYGTYGGNTQYHFFTIKYVAGDHPVVNIYSPERSEIIFGRPNEGNGYPATNISFRGNVDFTAATVTGLKTTATFA